jgi:hypothetical protein
MDYTREELIAICEAAVVPVQEWRNRDTPDAQSKLGTCWAMLRAGCEFHVITKPTFPGDGCVADARTIWLEVLQPDFCTFEEGSAPAWEHYYLPTRARLAERAGRDWY